MEQSAAYDQLTEDMDLSPQRLGTPFFADDNAAAYAVAQWQFPALKCPTNPQEPPVAGHFVMYAVDEVPSHLRLHFGKLPKGSVPLGRTDYLGCSGLWGEVGNPLIDSHVGAFSVRSKTRMGQITDGASKTILIGESPGAIGSEIPVDGERHSGFAVGNAWMGGMAIPILLGLDASKFSTLPTRSGPGITYETRAGLFNSLHPGGMVQFCLVDGSVHAVDQTIDKDLLNSMAGISEANNKSPVSGEISGGSGS